MRKFKGAIKYYSYIIFPVLIFIVSFVVNKNTNYFIIDDGKASSLVATSSTFIGVLITILTIYLAVPKNEYKREKLKQSGHEKIYLRNLSTGILLLFLSVLAWIFFDNCLILAMLFLSGISNIIISIYYTFQLIKLM